MNYIIFDLEATCWRDSRAKQQKEIIEIGAVKMNNMAEVESEFSHFVRPRLYPQLSSFCKKLTSISQDQVNRARYFPYVIREFKEWIGTEYILCSWGFYDKKQLIQDCKLHRLESEWAEDHISIKHQYGKLKKYKQQVGVKKALEAEGFTFEGIPHRGIDDARNIAKIFAKYMDEWVHPS